MTDLNGLPISISGNSYQTMPLTRIQSVVMPVVVISPDAIQIIGTAFTIMKEGVLLTAKHVIEEALRICKEVPDSWVFVVYVDSGVGRDAPTLLGGPIPIQWINMNDSTDVALLQVSLLKDGQQYKFPYIGISTRPPSVGESAFGLGYTRMDTQRSERIENILKVSVSQDFNSTAGVVREVFPNGRDRLRLPFPCFQLNARFSGGMSGGPIISASTSRVAGLVCSSFTADGDSEYISYATMMVSAMGLYVRAVLDGQEGDYSILELAQGGYVDADDHVRHVGIQTNPDGTRTLEFRLD